METTPKPLLNKLIFPKIFCLFEQFNLEEANKDANNKNSNLYNINNSSPQIILNSPTKNNTINLILLESILNNIEKLFDNPSVGDNEDFYLGILNIIQKLDELINYFTTNNNNWRLIKKITFIILKDNIYKLINKLDQHAIKIFNIAKRLYTNEYYEIKIDSVKIFAKICKSKFIWEDVIKFVETSILTNRNYYERRLYLYFFEELTKNFSYKFLKDKGQIDELMKLINDNNQIMPKFLKLIKIFFPLVTDDKIKFLIYNKLELIRKKINNNEINDQEVIEVNYNYYYIYYIK